MVDSHLDWQLALAIPEEARALAIRYLAHETLHADPAQPRTEADAELKASIASEGILQPIQVRPHPELLGEYMILDGERRWRGAAGVMATVPVIVREDQEEDARRLIGQLVSNSGKPLTPLEEARAYGKLLTATGMGQGELAERLGIPRTTMGDRVRLLELGPWMELLEKGHVPFSLAVQALVPVRGVPEKLHAEAIPRMRRDYRWGQKPAFGGSAEDFKRIVGEVYKSYCYPLNKTKSTYDQQPEFATAMHGAECDCGGVTFSFGSEQARAACGNPAWWKPKRDAARRAAKAKKATKAGKDAPTRTPGWQKLPAGASVRKVKGYGDVGHHETAVIVQGRWNLQRDPFDPTVFLAHVKAADLVATEPTEGAYDRERKVVTGNDTAALKLARKAFTNAWAIREKELLATLQAELTKVAAAHDVSGPGTPAIAAALAVRNDGRDLLILATMHGIAGTGVLGDEDDGNAWRAQERFAKAAGKLSEAEASLLLTHFATAAALKKSPDKWLAAMRGKELQRLSETPIVWPKAEPVVKPKAAKKGKAKAKAAKALVPAILDDDEDDL